MSLHGRWTSGAALLALLLSLGTCLVSSADEASIEARVDKQALFIDDYLTLTVTVKGGDERPELPDISDDFSVVSESSSHSMTIINMQIESSTNYQYVLQPEKVGTLTVPPIKVRAGRNTLQTEPITVNVRESRSAPNRQAPAQGRSQGEPGPDDEIDAVPRTSGDSEIFVRLSVDKNEVFLGEQLTMTFQVFNRAELASADYTPPPCTNFWKEDIEGKRSYNTVVDRRRYRVEELQVALFPTKTGQQVIGPATLKCTIDTFFTPGFHFRRQTPSSTRVLQTEEIKVNVKPLPKGAPADFAGTVGQFSIEASVNERSVELGKPVTFSVRVWGTGNVRTIPPIDKPAGKAFDVYEPNVKEQIDRSKSPIRGSKTTEFVIVPKQPGTVTIPAVGFSYFDPVREQYRTVQTKSIAIKVTGSASSQPDAAPIIGMPEKSEISQIGVDIDHIKPRMAAFQDFSPDLYRKRGTMLLILLPGLVLLGLIARDVVVRKLVVETGLSRQSHARKQVKRGLARAKARMDPSSAAEFYNEVASSLIGFISQRFDVSAPSVSAANVESLIGDSSNGRKAAALASECLEKCDYYRFSAQKSTVEEMDSVLSMASNAVAILDRIKPSKTEASST